MGACIQAARTVAVRPGRVKGSTELSPLHPSVSKLSSEWRGQNAHVEDGRVLSGRGAAYGTVAFTEDLAYLELVVKLPGYFAVGIAPSPLLTPAADRIDLNKKICDGRTSFGLTSDMLAAVPQPDDVIGVFVERENGAIKLSFTLNGLPLGDMYDCPKLGSDTRIPADIMYHPIAYVSKGAMIEVNMQRHLWHHSPFPGDDDWLAEPKETSYQMKHSSLERRRKHDFQEEQVQLAIS